MIGTRQRIAISSARRIFRIVSGHHEPAFTVASFATTTTARPCTVPTPVTTPAPGASPSYWPSATSRPTATERVPGSSRWPMRSRAVSLFCACCRSIFSGPPPSWRRASSSSTSRVSRLSRRDRAGAASAFPVAGMLGEPGADVLDRLGCRCTGAEQAADAHPAQLLHVFLRDDPAARDEHVVRTLLAQELEHAREQRHVRTGQHGERDDVHVLLHGGARDHLGRLVQPRVDYFEAGIAERAGDNHCATVVAVEARLRNQHTNLSFGHGLPFGRERARRAALQRAWDAGSLGELWGCGQVRGGGRRVSARAEARSVGSRGAAEGAESVAGPGCVRRE